MQCVLFLDADELEVVEAASAAADGMDLKGVLVLLELGAPLPTVAVGKQLFHLVTTLKGDESSAELVTLLQ